RKAARISGRIIYEPNAVVIDRFFETKREALSWASRNPLFMTVLSSRIHARWHSYQNNSARRACPACLLIAPARLKTPASKLLDLTIHGEYCRKAPKKLSTKGSLSFSRCLDQLGPCPNASNT